MGDILLPLALLYAENRKKIESATKFQKLAFLAQEETEAPHLHDFQEDKYGPFSPTLAGSIKTLEKKGVIKKEVEITPTGNERYVYYLTNKGVRVVKSLIHERDEDVESVLEPVDKIKKRKGDWPLDRLLRYVYKKYPDYTGESELDLADEV